MFVNSADGNFTVKPITKVTIHPDGKIVWKPPAIYKSLCPIDVEFFPFDEQQCTIKIGSWTYHEYAVKIIHKSVQDDRDDLRIIEEGINLDDYYKSTEWDLLAVRSPLCINYTNFIFSNFRKRYFSFFEMKCRKLSAKVWSYNFRIELQNNNFT